MFLKLTCSNPKWDEVENHGYVSCDQATVVKNCRLDAYTFQIFENLDHLEYFPGHGAALLVARISRTKKK